MGVLFMNFGNQKHKILSFLIKKTTDRHGSGSMDRSFSGGGGWYTVYCKMKLADPISRNLQIYSTYCRHQDILWTQNVQLEQRKIWFQIGNKM